jgi:hypothetical protein
MTSPPFLPDNLVITTTTRTTICLQPRARIRPLHARSFRVVFNVTLTFQPETTAQEIFFSASAHWHHRCDIGPTSCSLTDDESCCGSRQDTYFAPY